MSLLRVTNLSHSFEYPLFENISFSLDKQKSLAIVGVSGSGKSTLLHICSTLLKPLSGSVCLFGEDLYSKSPQEILQLRRESLGIIFQSHYLFKGFKTKENLELACLLNNTSLDGGLLEKIGISQLMDQKVTELSGGQQQRVSIARVLAKKPKILFADEPTGNLDAKTAGEVMDILFDYIAQNDAALMLVTHDMQLASRCDTTLHIDDFMPQ
ncbi:MAG: ABC transporter ATP-binding protein [Sulfurospirillum sp.]|nr:ABC transporter ATP-binding protein [Sulfurospirillum sp.]